MKKNRIFGVITCLLVATTVLSSCGNSGATQPNPTASTESNEGADATKQSPFTVKIMAIGDAKTEDTKEIAALASKITEGKYNTTLDVTRVGFGNYTKQINLMLASGEKFDLMYEYSGNVTSAISNGQIVSIDDALKETGKDLLEQISEEDWRCVTRDGEIYGVPANKEKATGWGFVMDKEMADATGVDYQNIKEQKDLEPLLLKVKELYPNVYPVVGHNGVVTGMSNQDDLGGDFGSLLDSSSSDTTVINYYKSDKFLNEVKLRYDWAQKGLIMPDASTNTESGDSLIGAGKGFGRFINTKPGIEQEVERVAGKDVVVLELIKPYTTTTRVDIVWYVPHNAKDPKRSVQILNEMYTNPELSNLLINGIEGKHYVVKDAAQGIINFPEGVDGSNTGYSSHPWSWPNEMISYVWEGNPADLWTQTDKFNKEAIVSPAKGFTWDNSLVQNEVTACANVKAKYEGALMAGSLDPETTVPKMIAELDAAGADNIIAEKQKQLDAWLANNK